MAKKRRARKQAADTGLISAAESIGTTLGRAAAKLDGWLSQREEIINELNAAIDSAHGMLSRVTGGRPARRKPGRPPKNQTRGSGPMHDISMLGARLGSVAAAPAARKRKPLSKAARKKISDAQKARWAKQKSSAK